jgi:2-polyprenyl-6-methoxyphenol hydroxylase-like FAD-dependent oxidoreductase
MKIDNSVCVVGAGPVGLTAALVLARRGVPVRVLERNPSLSTASRASTFHPSTLDLLDDLGIVQGLLRCGRKICEIHWRVATGDLVAAMSYSLLAERTRHPYRLHAEQYHLTRLLWEQLRALDNVTVEFGVEVEQVTPLPQGAVVLARRGTTRDTLTVGYLLAADGARSTVRRSVGIRFAETDYPYYALRVITSTDLAGLIPATAPLTYMRDIAGSASLLGLPDHWRLIFRIDAATDPAHAIRPRSVAELIHRSCPFTADHLEITDAHTYRLARGVADTYRYGRVVLMGDATHITSTAGGLNMNCGLHDAIELASTLASVLDGRCGPEALDAAARRRRAVVTDQVIPRSEARAAGVATGEARSLRRAMCDIIETAACPERTREYLITTSMLDSVPASNPSCRLDDPCVSGFRSTP